MAKKHTNATEFIARLTEVLRRGLTDHGITETQVQIAIDTAIRGAVLECYGNSVYFPQNMPLPPLSFTQTVKPKASPLVKLISFDDSTSGAFYNDLFDCLFDSLTRTGISDKPAETLADAAIIAVIEIHGGDVISFPVDSHPATRYTRQHLTEYTQ